MEDGSQTSSAFGADPGIASHNISRILHRLIEDDLTQYSHS